MMLGFVLNSNADVEWTIWEGSMNASSSGTAGSWDNSLYLNNNNFNNLAVGDVIYFTLTKNANATGQGHVVLYYQNTLVIDETTTWPETELTSIDTDGNCSYEITSDNIKYFKGYYDGTCTSVTFINLVIKGYDFTLTKVAIKKNFSAIKKTLSDASVSLGNWSGSYEVESSALSNIKAGDYYYMPATRQTTYIEGEEEKAVEYWQTQFYYDWNNLYNVNSLNHDVWAEIQAADLDNIKANTLRVKGQYYNATGLYLIHPVSSFSIGSIGYATFSADQEVTAPESVTAYKATVDGSSVKLTQFTDNVIPANTGAIIAGDEGAVLEFTASSTGSTETSDLQAVTTATDVTTLESGYDYYVLYNNPTGGNYSLSLSNDDDLSYGWNSSYSASSKTITFTEAWGARGWSVNSDLSAYNSVVVEFGSAAPYSGVLKVGYNDENADQEVGYEASATSVTITLDENRKTNNVTNIYLSSSAASDLVISSAYIVPTAGSQKAEFRKTTSGTLAANKAYLKIASGSLSRSLSISFASDNEITDIQEVKVADNKKMTTDDDVYYDLTGRRIEKPAKGLYIKNGKKYFAE